MKVPYDRPSITEVFLTPLRKGMIIRQGRGTGNGERRAEEGRKVGNDILYESYACANETLLNKKTIRPLALQ